MARVKSMHRVEWDAAAQPASWTWTSPAEREKRNVGILELWEMGWSRASIAERFDITPQRVSQIVNTFGAGWR
jgi:hypothetical protein